MNISTRLKMIRESFGLTLQEVENRTQIGMSSLSEFENGKREPSLSHLKKLAILYDKSITFFLEKTSIVPPTLLWRKRPDEAKCNKIESKFFRLCKQYKNLEIWTKTPKTNNFEKLFIVSFPEKYSEIGRLAHCIGKQMDLGSYPGESLFRILEEIYEVKIFHLPLGDDASSACFYTKELGPAIMLNSDSKQWRRNFDLAHELFHLITWKARLENVSDSCIEDKEEKFANYFASTILMPEEAVRDSIESILPNNKMLNYDHLDSIARQFGVSIEALSWRLHYIYNIPQEEIKQIIEKAKSYSSLPLRQNDSPADLPSRYKALAVIALKYGEISSQQFANYLGINMSETYSYQISGTYDAIQINTGSI